MMNTGYICTVTRTGLPVAWKDHFESNLANSSSVIRFMSANAMDNSYSHATNSYWTTTTETIGGEEETTDTSDGGDGTSADGTTDGEPTDGTTDGEPADGTTDGEPTDGTTDVVPDFAATLATFSTLGAINLMI